jgi:hypothetical protein
MPKGGARPRSGPTPDPNALRRDRDKGEWTRLPKSGCHLDIPEWPAEFDEPSMNEMAMWQRLWRAPQALVWHANNILDIVVVYVRASLQAAQAHAGPGILASYRQYSDALLLTPAALAREGFYIEGDEYDKAMNPDLDAPEQSEAERRLQRTGTDGADVVRGRFTVVKPVDDDDDSDPRATDE